MKRQKLLVPLVLTLALLNASCNNDNNGGSSTNTSASETTTTTALPKFEAKTTMATLQAKKKIVVGTKFNQLGSGLLNPTTQKPEEFDIEIAKLIAVSIFGKNVNNINDKIKFKKTISSVRELIIQNGKIDIVVATYTINDTRKTQVDFAGPYVIDKQTVIVKSNNTTIKTLADLNNKKMCTDKKSTTPSNLDKLQIKPSELVLQNTYPKCADELRQGRMEAMVTNRNILLGLTSSSNGTFKLIDIDINKKPLNISLKKNDDAFQKFLNTRLKKIYKSSE